MLLTCLLLDYNMDRRVTPDEVRAEASSFEVVRPLMGGIEFTVHQLLNFHGM